MARLVINPGSPTAWEIQLRPGINLVGRGFANDFKIEDPSVSSSHCQIVVDHGNVIIRDLGSTNGTYVNRAAIKEAVLQPGQSIHLGAVEMIFQAGPPANPNVGKTELIPAPPVARQAAPIPAFPAIGKPVVATPIVSPQPIAPRIAQPAVATPVVATPVTAPGAPPTVVPFALPGSRPAAAIPVAPGTVPAVAINIPPAPARLAVQTGIPVPVAAPVAGPLSPPRPAGLALATPIAPRSSAVPMAITTQSQAPLPIVSDHSAPPVMAAPVTGSGNCKHHPKTMGRYYCSACQQYFCEICVSSRTVSGVQHKSCRHCGAECLPVQVQLKRPAQAGFFRRIPGAFPFPLRGAGVLILLVGIVITLLLKFGQWLMTRGAVRPMILGIFLQVFAGGYLFTYLQSIIYSTVAEDREMPDLPGISSFFEDILMPFFRFLGLVAFCFGPAIALEIWAVASGETSGALAIGILVTFILGGLYFPMAFLAVATLDSVAAANPLIIVPSMLKVPFEYLVTIFFLAGVVAFRSLGDFLVKAVFPKGWLTHSMGELFAMIGSLAFLGFLGFYLLVVSVHILGLLYVSKKQKLGWLDR